MEIRLELIVGFFSKSVVKSILSLRKPHSALLNYASFPRIFPFYFHFAFSVFVLCFCLLSRLNIATFVFIYVFAYNVQASCIFHLLLLYLFTMFALLNFFDFVCLVSYVCYDCVALQFTPCAFGPFFYLLFSCSMLQLFIHSFCFLIDYFVCRRLKCLYYFHRPLLHYL